MSADCPQCGKHFTCGAKTGEASCWCFTKARVLIDGHEQSCLCTSCLDKKIEKCGEYSYFRFFLAYRGTDFSGFQMQDGQRTVEEEFKKALLAIIPLQDINMRAAGRTDAGVHAHGQVISASFFTRMTPRQLTLALATKLPKDMSVWRVDKMPGVFDARSQSIGKRYLYRILQALVPDPFSRDCTWHVRETLDVLAMKAAAKMLVGHHDFSAFRGSLCTAQHARRYLWHVDVEKKDNIIEIDVRGNAFCLNMVRIIVGTLRDVGRGKLDSSSINGILASKDRTRAGMTAPPHGLTLFHVYYPDDCADALIPADAEFPRYPITEQSWPFANCEIISSDPTHISSRSTIA